MSCRLRVYKVTQVVTVAQPIKLLAIQSDDFTIHMLWPFKSSLLQLLLPETESILLPVEDIHTFP